MTSAQDRFLALSVRRHTDPQFDRDLATVSGRESPSKQSTDVLQRLTFTIGAQFLNKIEKENDGTNSTANEFRSKLTDIDGIVSPV
ncbi:hypothetical protein TNCV_1197401 [Trichonephila clavipes]|uniref:Uncharacterized protein n=1 Tax=Trichonephila clavipes TaxID=2585209 RepID=A0A8X6S1B3_TRICX|nr:hypothetical protein TNCV_1197401 [Trichonephila clavipes]